MENYGTKTDVVTFTFMFFSPVKLRILYRVKEMTPISCYKCVLKVMSYLHDT